MATPGLGARDGSAFLTVQGSPVTIGAHRSAERGRRRDRLSGFGASALDYRAASQHWRWMEDAPVMIDKSVLEKTTDDKFRLVCAFAEDRVVILDEPMKDARGEFLRNPDNSIAWLRFGGRVHAPQV